MRLSVQDIKVIKKATKEIYGNSPIWLFGSRVDDNKKGGDIDLFIETKQKSSIDDKIKFLRILENNGIDRKVDLIVKSSDSNHRSIFDTAKQTGILL